jgi:hypothetical protein
VRPAPVGFGRSVIEGLDAPVAQWRGIPQWRPPQRGIAGTEAGGGRRARSCVRPFTGVGRFRGNILGAGRGVGGGVRGAGRFRGNILGGGASAGPRLVRVAAPPIGRRRRFRGNILGGVRLIGGGVRAAAAWRSSMRRSRRMVRVNVSICPAVA